MGVTTSDLLIESQQGYALDQKDGLEKVACIVRDERPVTVILETLDTVTSSLFNENKAHDVKGLFSGLDEIQNIHPCTIIVSHHHGKKGVVGDSMSWIRGSSSLPARVDVGYSLRRFNIGGSEHSFLVQPYPKRVKTVPGFQVKLVTTEYNGLLDRATLSWVREWDTDLPPELIHKRDLVLAVVKDRGSEGATVQQVVQASSGYLSEREVRDLLDSLEQESLLVGDKEAHNRFRYWVPEASPYIVATTAGGVPEEPWEGV